MSKHYFMLLNDLRTILLARPSTGREAVMTQGEWPFEIGAGIYVDDHEIKQCLDQIADYSHITVVSGRGCQSVRILKIHRNILWS